MAGKIYVSFLVAVCLVASGFTLHNEILPAPPPELQLIHYWNFNDEPDYLLPNVGNGSISSTGTIAASDGQDFDMLNAQNGDEALFHLRISNPIGSVLRFDFTTEGHDDIVVKYVTRRSTKVPARKR